jgi:transcriptional regulator with XRE-family HTH domain
LAILSEAVPQPSKPTNRGAIALKLKLAARGARADLAREFDIEQSLVSHWLSGDRKPDPKNRARIEDGYGVPWRIWDDEFPVAEADKVEAELRAQEAAADAEATFRRDGGSADAPKVA